MGFANVFCQVRVHEEIVPSQWWEGRAEGIRTIMYRNIVLSVKINLPYCDLHKRPQHVLA